MTDINSLLNVFLIALVMAVVGFLNKKYDLMNVGLLVLFLSALAMAIQLMQNM